MKLWSSSVDKRDPGPAAGAPGLRRPRTGPGPRGHRLRMGRQEALSDPWCHRGPGPRGGPRVKPGRWGRQVSGEPRHAPNRDHPSGDPADPRGGCWLGAECGATHPHPSWRATSVTTPAWSPGSGVGQWAPQKAPLCPRPLSKPSFNWHFLRAQRRAVQGSGLPLWSPVACRWAQLLTPARQGTVPAGSSGPGPGASGGWPAQRLGGSRSLWGWSARRTGAAWGGRGQEDAQRGPVGLAGGGRPGGRAQPSGISQAVCLAAVIKHRLCARCRPRAYPSQLRQPLPRTLQRDTFMVPIS